MDTREKAGRWHFPDGPITTGDSRPAERLSDDELAFHANRLLGEFKQALLEIPEFCQRAGKRILDIFDEEDAFVSEGENIPFLRNGVPYRVTYRPHEFQGGLGRDQRAHALYVTRKPFGTHGAVHIEIKTGVPKLEGGKHWDMVRWHGIDDPGEAEKDHTNTPMAIENIEVLLEELKGAIDSLPLIG